MTSLMPQTAFLYIYCDASPQFRGHELFSASVEVVWGHGADTSFLRRLLPQVAVRRDMMSSEMKLYTLLWQIWLVAGPGWRSFRWFLSRIVSLTTDFGVERLLVDKKDLVPKFFRVIGRIDSVPAAEWTFPNAVLIGGWRHIWDTILQRGCCSWRWFPVFLRRLKAVTRFVRNNKEMVCVCLRRNGCSGLAGMVEHSSFPNFAEWRWETLYECADVIESFWTSLRCVMEFSDFKNQRDGRR